MRTLPSPCPHCKIIIDTVANGNEIPKENDFTICIGCGEILMLGPHLTLKKCDLTPEQIADKLGLLIYGTLLQLQDKIKLQKQVRELLGRK